MAKIPAHVQTEDTNFVRETTSRALLCTNTTALQKHRRQVQQLRDRFHLAKKVESLEQRIEELTSLVRCAVAKLRN